MKIAIIGDTHFGYVRFEEDAYRQAEVALLDAQEKADIIIYAGDVFDTKIPKLETIHRTMDILKKVKVPVYAIHGNHERRSKDMVNPVELLAQVGLLHHVHGKAVTFEKNGERLQIMGMGNVPEDWAHTALQTMLKGFEPDKKAFKLLMIHQSIKDLIPQAEEEISTEDLEELPFDLIVNGHIHKHHALMKGKLLIPGSMVITQLKKEEADPKGYILYDTLKKSYEFITVPCRSFFFEELNFNEASLNDVRQQVSQTAEKFRKENPEAIIRIKITGTLKSGLNPSDLDADIPGVYLDNALSTESLKASLEKIRQLREDKIAVKDIAAKELKEKTKEITLFDPIELFEKLLEGTDETLEYIQTKGQKK